MAWCARECAHARAVGPATSLLELHGRVHANPLACQCTRAIHTLRNATHAHRTYFVDKTRDNLHVVLAFSPIGDPFRERLRQFPSLVNCCTIDWCGLGRGSMRQCGSSLWNDASWCLLDCGV
jgi:hypothetical protein